MVCVKYFENDFQMVSCNVLFDKTLMRHRWFQEWRVCVWMCVWGFRFDCSIVWNIDIKKNLWQRVIAKPRSLNFWINKKSTQCDRMFFFFCNFDKRSALSEDLTIHSPLVFLFMWNFLLIIFLRSTWQDYMRFYLTAHLRYSEKGTERHSKIEWLALYPFYTKTPEHFEFQNSIIKYPGSNQSKGLREKRNDLFAFIKFYETFIPLIY